VVFGSWSVQTENVLADDIPEEGQKPLLAMYDLLKNRSFK